MDPWILVWILHLNLCPPEYLTLTTWILKSKHFLNLCQQFLVLYIKDAFNCTFTCDQGFDVTICILFMSILYANSVSTLKILWRCDDSKAQFLLILSLVFQLCNISFYHRSTVDFSPNFCVGKKHWTFKACVAKLIFFRSQLIFEHQNWSIL